MKKPRVIFIDGKNALYRFGWVHRNLSAEDGRQTGALYGLLRCLLRLKRKYPRSRFAMVWDGAGKGWRHELFPDYKGNRKKEKSEEIKAILAQKPLIEEAMRVLGIPFLCLPGVEADDLIGRLCLEAKRLNMRPVVYSSDRDFFQLMAVGVDVIRDADKESKLRPETPDTVKAHFGVLPENVVRLRALCGDKSDNIPSALPRLGPKTALKYLAAGVNPASDTGCPRSCKELRLVWGVVRRNYRLMQLDLIDLSFTKAVDKFRRAIETPHVHSYKELVKLLADLDMQELLDDRVDLFNLQKIPTNLS